MQETRRVARHRDEEWWANTLAVQRAQLLHCSQAGAVHMPPGNAPGSDSRPSAEADPTRLAANLLEQESVTNRATGPARGTLSTPGTAKGAGRWLSVPRAGPDTVLESTAATEALRAAREDAELLERATAAQQDTPNTVMAFKCESCRTSAVCRVFVHEIGLMSCQPGVLQQCIQDIPASLSFHIIRRCKGCCPWKWLSRVMYK